MPANRSTAMSRDRIRAARAAARPLPGATEYRRHRAVDVVLGGRPVRDRDAHVAAAAPGGAAHPARAVALHGVDHALGLLIAAEADEDLVEDDVVCDLGAALLQLRGEPAGEVAAPLDEVRDAVATELLQGSPRGEPARPTGRLEGEVGGRPAAG